MEPDRFAAIAADEQRAVVAANEQCLELQAHLPPIPVERASHARAIALVLLVIVLLIAAGYVAWRFLT